MRSSFLHLSVKLFLYPIWKDLKFRRSLDLLFNVLFICSFSLFLPYSIFNEHKLRPLSQTVLSILTRFRGTKPINCLMSFWIVYNPKLLICVQQTGCFSLRSKIKTCADLRWQIGFTVCVQQTGCFSLRSKIKLLVGLDGLEPSTSRLSGARSNHLSYRPVSFGFLRFGPERLALCLRHLCSPFCLGAATCR